VVIIGFIFAGLNPGFFLQRPNLMGVEFTWVWSY